jgi:hypothetical protein
MTVRAPCDRPLSEMRLEPAAVELEARTTLSRVALMFTRATACNSRLSAGKRMSSARSGARSQPVTSAHASSAGSARLT